MPTAKHRVYAVLEEAENDALRALAAKHKVTASWLVKRAVQALLKSDADPVQLSFDIKLERSR